MDVISFVSAHGSGNYQIPSPAKVTIKNEVHEPLNFIFDEHDEFTILNDLVVNRNLHQEVNYRDKDESFEKFKQQPINQFQCSIKGIDDSKVNYDLHVDEHKNHLTCAICRSVLKTIKAYEKHVANCKPFECKLCDKVIRFRPNFIKHMKIHKRKTNSLTNSSEISLAERTKFKCDECEKEFVSWEYFKVHKKSHTNDVNLTCNICGKEFSSYQCLKGHSKVHTGEKPYRCDVCGREFTQSYNLKVHSRLHSGEMPFECKICNRKMNTASSYAAHLKTHKQFKCEICNEEFNQKIKYMSHMGMHETGKVLECKICSKKFGRSSNFYNHQRIHLGIKKYVCYICGQGFVKSANLDGHILMHCKNG